MPQVDVREVGETLNSALKMMETIVSNIQRFVPKVRQMKEWIYSVVRKCTYVPSNHQFGIRWSTAVLRLYELGLDYNVLVIIYKSSSPFRPPRVCFPVSFCVHCYVASRVNCDEFL